MEQNTPISKKYRTRQDVKDMIKKKDDIEKEIFELQEQLKNSPKKLIDDEGFPVQGVDIHALLLLKNRVACLKTDHEQLMHDIERAMEEVFMSERTEEEQKEAEVQQAMEEAQEKQEAEKEEENYFKTHEPKGLAPMEDLPISKGKTMEEEEAEEGLFGAEETMLQKYVEAETEKKEKEIEKEKQEVAVGLKKPSKIEEEEPEKVVSPEEGELELEPFLKVEFVENNSPAFSAGLMAGDKIIKFGKITKKHIEKYSLTILADLVEKNLNKRIDVVVEREVSISAENAGNEEQDKDEAAEKKKKLVLKKLPLFPSSWEGKGYLGCQMNIIY